MSCDPEDEKRYLESAIHNPQVQYIINEMFGLDQEEPPEQEEPAEDVTAGSDESITPEVEPLPEPKPYPKNERGHRWKKRGIGYTKKDKSKNKKSRRKMAKKSKKRNR